MSALKGRVAVVAGAGSGIGRAIAAEIAARGASVWLVARSRDPLTQLEREIRSAGGEASVCVADLSSDDDLRGLHRRIEASGQGVDILVYNAARHAMGPLADASLADLDALYRANVRAPLALAQLLLPWLRAKRGDIVFINSSVGLQARAGVGLYAATKHALKALADTLRQEVNADGVRVLSVYPGRTATPGQAAIHEQEGRPYRPERLLQPEDVAQAVAAALTAERSAEFADLQIRSMQKP